MLEPSLTLTEIAADLGYADQAHFTGAFYRWTGEAPSAYRRRRFVPMTVSSATRQARNVPA